MAGEAERAGLTSDDMLWLDNNDTASGKAALNLSGTKSKLKVLKALQAAGCITLSCPDNSNRPYIIRPGEKSYLYTLERTELWVNRIISFIAGVLTSIAAHYIIQLLHALPS